MSSLALLHSTFSHLPLSSQTTLSHPHTESKVNIRYQNIKVKSYLKMSGRSQFKEAMLKTTKNIFINSYDWTLSEGKWQEINGQAPGGRRAVLRAKLASGQAFKNGESKNFKFTDADVEKLQQLVERAAAHGEEHEDTISLENASKEHRNVLIHWKTK
ncbi:hypothetical protein HYFRA_00008485 [Hymenoscyphus fraxineus]|uniref:Uncharacterized protein n=1 Tax=Hymenoscyphus fraxineus TaxID=746836 RepID=A0A9N9KRI5_9HELO|nr:hypothetical protein HYFRA_00008485 [Hymenoscyphus fraxineus]